MAINLNDWNKDWELMNTFFSPNEIRTIESKQQKLTLRNVAFCSFENRFAKSGGLGTIAAKFLPHLIEFPGVRRVLLITPFYPHIIDESRLAPTDIKPFDVMYAGKPVKVELLKFSSKPGASPQKDVEEYYLKATGFFCANNPINDPYGYFPNDSQRNDEAIRENALFFCKAVPQVMAVLGVRENLVFHLQEWQTALISLTAKEAMLDGTLESCGTVQTMHNPFDSWISTDMLAKIIPTKEIRRHKSFLEESGETAYQLGLQLVDAPLTTVSTHFAKELTSDLLQTARFAPHLQTIFRRTGIVGINNGLFIDFPPEFSPERDYSLEEIKAIKLEKRNELLKILAQYEPESHFGQLTYRNKTITRLPNRVPILVMSGRLDPLQKGFDVLLRALETFGKDEIKVVLTPMAVDVSDLDYFHELVSKRCGDLMVFPIRMERGYRELQMGSTFGIMPSIYEPFGAAIEYMVSGTVTIARQTGGLVDQIQDNVCGFLYRENNKSYTEENINAFADSGDIVQARKHNPWVCAMTDTLHKNIKKAVDIYQHHPNDYYGLIKQGLHRAASFTWQKAAESYFQVYGKINCF